ncbi:MAG: 3-isopropylmalate dehydratase small subunit [Pseudomonadales bacterium]
MKAINTVSGHCAPLDRANVDTDQIIPKQFLKSIRRTGFGDFLFDGWRFNDEGQLGMTPNERSINREFVLNDPRYQGAKILLARDNFGCGSSREHAVWALLEFGFDCVIAPSFADIFHNNCFKNGLLPVTLSEPEVDALFNAVDVDSQLLVNVDLRTQSVTWGDSGAARFEIDNQRKQKMLEGLDDIEMTLRHQNEIASFERDYAARRPWLFSSQELQAP